MVGTGMGAVATMGVAAWLVAVDSALVVGAEDSEVWAGAGNVSRFVGE